MTRSHDAGTRKNNQPHPQQLASSYFGPAEAERLRECQVDSGTENFSPTVRLEDAVLRVAYRVYCVLRTVVFYGCFGVFGAGNSQGPP